MLSDDLENLTNQGYIPYSLGSFGRSSNLVIALNFSF